MSNVWGIHNDTLTDELVYDGFVSIGWDELDYDLRTIGSSRDELKAVLAAKYPNRKPGAIAAWAGILHRFVYDIQVGDIVVAPFKPDSTINIGTVTGPYRFDGDATTHRHRRDIAWKKTGITRTVFTQPALYELGAFLTVFGIKKHDDEFRAVLATKNDSLEETSKAAEQASTNADESSTDEPRASRIDRHTRDFVLERLKNDLSHQEFEEFTAALLRALGYEARVTAYSQDGGVDVIAHRDPLGLEPPLMKVQCKHHTGTVGAPEVQQLVGTQSPSELSLFVTLGSYSREAQAIERTRHGLRLINGEDFVDLVLRTYDRLGQSWQSRIPLRQVLVVDDSADV